jgi:hypothetical protein
MVNMKACMSWWIFWVSFFVVWVIVPANQAMGAPVPGGPGFVTVGSLAFRPGNPNNIAYGYASNRLYNTGSSTAAFYAPVQLPQGATITQVVLYFVDNGTSDIIAYLLSYPLDGPIDLTEMMYITTSGASPNSRTLIGNTFPNGSVIDNQSNFYIISVGLPPTSNYAIGGVRIDYSFPINLPLIMK